MLSPSPTPSSFPPSLSGDLKSSLIGKSIAMISILSLKIDVERGLCFSLSFSNAGVFSEPFLSILHSLDQIALEIFSKTYRIKRDSGLLEWVIRGFTHPPHSCKYLVKEKGTLAQQRRGGGHGRAGLPLPWRTR